MKTHSTFLKPRALPKESTENIQDDSVAELLETRKQTFWGRLILGALGSFTMLELILSILN